jgi:hypothetical protein
MVISVAGLETIIAVKLAFLADFRFSIAIALSVFASGWAIGERVLRHRKVEYFQSRIKLLETRIDPNRTSSGLTPMGKTNPKDKLS